MKTIIILFAFWVLFSAPETATVEEIINRVIICGCLLFYPIMTIINKESHGKKNNNGLL